MRVPPNRLNELSFSVTILGSASAKPTAGRHPSAQVVNVHEQLYLVDAGEGVQRQLFRYGINPLKLRAVFIPICTATMCSASFRDRKSTRLNSSHIL